MKCFIQIGTSLIVPLSQFGIVQFDRESVAVQVVEARGLITWANIAAGLARNGAEVIYEPIPVSSSVICYAKVNSDRSIEKLAGFTKKQLLDANVGFAGEIDGY